MKKLLLLLLFILIGCSEPGPVNLDKLIERNDVYYTRNNELYSYSGPVFQLYRNGQISTEGILKDGKMDGPYKSYYEKHKNFPNSDLIIEKESTYKDGELDGPYKYYNDNLSFSGNEYGTLVEEGNYKDGKKEGLWKTYEKDFVYRIEYKNSEGTYKDGKKDGVWKIYELDGRLKHGVLKYELTYKNDIQNGPQKFYQIDGRTNKQLRYEVTYKDGTLDGPRKYYYDGQLINGFHKSYDENRKIDSEGTYKNGVREGPYVYYYSSDGDRLEGTYKDGLREGVFKKLENNRLESEDTWKNGKRNGPYRFYYKYGQLRQEGQYKDGEPNGTFTSYTKGGQISKVETLKDGKLIERSGGNDEYERPCDLDKFKSVVMTNNKIIYGDRLYDVEVDSPNEGGYFDYRVIVWKRTGGLEYKFFRSNCSEI